MDDTPITDSVEKCFSDCTVLMVEDSTYEAEAQADVLRLFNLTVLHVHTGDEALQYIGGDYRLAIVDLKLVGMTGLEVARRIRAERPTVPIVIVTGYASDQDRLELSKITLITIIEKPLTEDNFADMLEMFGITL